jgi:hypothetical protein
MTLSIAALLMASGAAESSQAREGINLLTNGGFEEGSSMPLDTWAPLVWSFYGDHTAEVVSKLEGAIVAEGPIEGEYCLHITVPAAGAHFYDVGVHHGGHTFEAGKKYTVSLFLKSKQGAARMNIKLELGEDPWTAYAARSVSITETWAQYSVTTPVFASTVTGGNLTFHIGYAACDFWMDDVRLYEGDYVPRAYHPDPPDRGTRAETTVKLSWDSGGWAGTYNVYFGDNFDDVNTGAVHAFCGNQAATSLLVGLPGCPYPNGLVPGTTYYWRIDEVNDANSASPWRGDIWSFSIQPRTAYNPDPADGAQPVPLDTKLRWSAGFGAKLHTVYFAEDFDSASGDTQGGALAATTSYSPPSLKPGKVYYWRVDESDLYATHEGPVWSFTTAPDAIPAPPPRTFYIAVDGNDGGAGSQTQPWQTIEHATQTIDPGDTVIIGPGVYRVSGLTFGPAGESYDRVTTYKCEEGARAIFSTTDDRPPGVWLMDYVRVEGLWFGGKCNPSESCDGYIGLGGGGNPIGRGKQLVNCTIFGYNGGILLGQSEDLLIYGSRFVHTGSGWYGHAIYLSGGYPPNRCSNHAIVDNNIFIHGEGYAIHGWHGPKSMIITRNFISRHWGGIVMDGSDHLIANNLVWRCGPDDEGGRGGTGIAPSGENIVVVNNIVRECGMGWRFGPNYLERNAGLNAGPEYVLPILLAPGNEEADFGVPASVIDDTVAQLGEIFDQPVDVLYHDQRIEPLFCALRMVVPDASSLRNAGRAWYDLDKTVNIGPDVNQPACLNTLWYAFRRWGLKDWDDSWNVYETSPPWWGDARTPDSRDNDGDGTANDSDPDNDNDGLLDEADTDRDGDGVQDTAEIILAEDPDDKGSVPPATPLLELSRDMIVVQSVYGRDPPGVTLSLRNGGVGTADWQVLSDAPWVEVNPISGSLGTGIELPLAVRFHTQALPVGAYSTHMTFVYGPQAMLIPVQLEVLDESVIEQALLHHWTFDEDEGNIASDAIGGAHGTIYGAQWTDGVAGHALSFDGIDDYVDIPQLADDFSQFTVTLWFKTTVPGTGGYVGDSFSDNTMWQRFITAGADGGEMSLATIDGRLRGEFNLFQTGDARGLYSEALVTDGQWHHAAMTVSAKDRIALFLDGQQVDERSIADDAEAINEETGTHSIGRTVWWQATMYYTGAIDDVRFYGRPLCPAEIEVMYDNARPK